MKEESLQMPREARRQAIPASKAAAVMVILVGIIIMAEVDVEVWLAREQ